MELGAILAKPLFNARPDEDEQLHPGELFGSGTFPGGSGIENGYWLNRGNILNLKIDKIDELSNMII